MAKTISRIPVFPNTFKSVGVADMVGAISNSANQMGLEIINAGNFYACDSLYVRFVFLHDATAAGRNITAVSVQSDATTVPTYKRTKVVNIAPTSLTLDLSVDLSEIRNVTGRNVVMLTFNGPVSGTIKLFKVDMRYQVQGIR